MNDILKWLGRVLFMGIFWVFILSITIEGRTIFSYAHEVLVQNSLVEYIDTQLADIWDKVKETAHVTFVEVSSSKDEI